MGHPSGPRYSRTVQHSGTIEPVSPRRGRDCLVELLLDFWALDLNKLPLDQLHGWFNTVALCITHLLRADAQHPDRPFRAAEWLEIVVGRVAEEFPRFRRRGGEDTSVSPYPHGPTVGAVLGAASVDAEVLPGS
jgi:hypothetical protein